MKEMLDDMTNETFGCNYDTLNVRFLQFMKDFASSDNKQNKQLALLKFMLDTQINGLSK